MNREEALQIFSQSEEIVSATDVDASIARMAGAIRAEMSDVFPLVLSVMGGAAVFTGMLLPHPDFCGFEVPDRYVFGCGMDAKGYWRNLPTIRALTANV
jgi:hypoxanthine-guanine phosphoribosyltransferase